MKKIILFGSGKIAEVLLYYFDEIYPGIVIASTVDNKYLPSSQYFKHLPCVPFDNIEAIFPPSQFDMFIALGYQDMNKLRESKCTQARLKGYKLVSLIHPNSCLPTNCKFGDNSFVMDRVNIHPFVSIGSNTFIWSGSMVGHHTKIGNNCWITSSANISGNVLIDDNCFIAVNSTITNSIKVGKSNFIGSNTLINSNTENDAVYVQKQTGKYRLNSSQFVKLINFSSI